MTDTSSNEAIGAVIGGMIAWDHAIQNSLTDSHLDEAIDWAKRFRSESLSEWRTGPRMSHSVPRSPYLVTIWDISESFLGVRGLARADSPQDRALREHEDGWSVVNPHMETSEFGPGWAVTDYDGNVKPGRWTSWKKANNYGLCGRYLLSGFEVVRVEA